MSKEKKAPINRPNFEDLKTLFRENHKSLKALIDKAEDEITDHGKANATTIESIKTITDTMNGLYSRLDKAEAKFNRRRPTMNAIDRKKGRDWTPAENRKLRQLARQGLSGREAGKVLQRTRGAVAYKAMVLGVSFHKINQPKGVQKRLARQRRRAR